MMARAMAKAGHVVYAGPWASDGNIRPFEELAQAFTKEHPVDLRTIELHVLSKSSVSAAVDTVMKAPEGQLDIPPHSSSCIFRQLRRHAAHRPDSPSRHGQGKPGIVRIDFVKFCPWAKQ